MGRTEHPVVTANPGLGLLANWLRRARAEARLTYAELAGGTPYTATTLQRATTGARIPKLPVVEAFARACGAPVKEARKLWRKARWIEHQALHPPRAATSLPLKLISDPADLLVALRDLYYKAGAMPLREMEQRAGEHGLLPHTTVHRMLHGQTVLQLEQLMAFLQVCEVPEKEHARWQQAWMRAWRYQEMDRQGMPVIATTVHLGRTRAQEHVWYEHTETRARRVDRWRQPRPNYVYAEPSVAVGQTSPWTTEYGLPS